MKLCVTVLILGAALAASPAMAEKKDGEGTPKKVSGEYTPVGALCVQKAEAQGLKESDNGWIKFVAHCAAEHSPPNPNDKAIAKCYSDAEPFSGTPQWIEHFKPCAERVLGKFAGKQQ